MLINNVHLVKFFEINTNLDTLQFQIAIVNKPPPPSFPMFPYNLNSLVILNVKMHSARLMCIVNANCCAALLHFVYIEYGQLLTLYL